MRILSNLIAKIKNPESKFYLTKEGLEKKKREYNYLKQMRLFKLRGETPKFMHSDEIDQEYFDFQDDVSLLDAKLSDLKYVIKNARLIKPPPKRKRDIIGIGAKVFLDIDGQEDKFQIVGTLEANPMLGKISNESPVGRALLNHKVGDTVVISSPIKTHYKIKKIEYS